MSLLHKYDIEGLTYVLPKQPPLHTMRNYGLPKIKQVWTRRTEYEELDWSDGWEDRARAGNAVKEVQFISEEIDRLHNGEWIIIEGKPVYLNNHIYFFHQWFVLEDDIYPEFRDTTVYYYRFLELVDNIKMCAGHTLLKGRRLGATSMIMSRILLKMLLKRNKNFGIVSKTGEDAQGAFDFLVMGFQSLPVFLKPQTEGTDSPKKTLYLKQQASRIKKGQSTSGERKGFNNKANWKATKLNSYDSGAYEEILVDECMSPETKIMMGDGTFLEIDKIQEGDYVMTEGSVPRKVVQRTDGYDRMFTVHQPYGLDYKVNSRHRIVVDHRMGGGNKKDGEYIATPEEVLSMFPKSSYRVLNRVVSKGVEFEEKELFINPYLMGVWLGDGDSDSFRITGSPEEEVIEYLKEYCETNKIKYSINGIKSCSSVVRFAIIGDGSVGSNKYLDELKRLNVFNNKHIPEVYMKGSIKQRLELLAGIIDTDGYAPNKHKNPNIKRGSIEISMSKEGLISQIRQLALSCGLNVGNVRHKKSNFNTDVYTISISGELFKIPIRISRKSFKGYEPQYKSRLNRITINPIPERGRYVGIQVEAHEDNHRKLILEDFTLTMNSGKFPPETPIDDYLPIVVKCVKKGVVVTGKLSLPTTVNAPDKGGSGYRTIWNNSDQTKADKYGQTKSMLYRIQIPGYYGQLGYMDRYGNSVVENPTPEQVAWLSQDENCPDPTIGAKTFQAHHRKMLENDQDALQEAKRLDPWSADEVFETANESCIFDMPNLVAQEKVLMDRMEEQGLNTEKDELGRRGWFHKMPNGRVRFFDDKDGLCYVYKLLPEEESNKFVIGKEGQTPTNEEFGAAGLDPVASGQPTVEKGSDACMIIRSRYSSMDPENTGTIVAMFLGRMKSTKKFHEQIFNMLQYYGVKMLGERAPSNWIDYASDQEPKLLGYLYGTKQSDGTERKGIPPGNTKSLIEEHADAQVLASLADHDKIPCIRLVRDRMAFRVSERTLYDACMADGYANMALKIPFKKPVHKKVKLNVFAGGKVHEYH